MTVELSVPLKLVSDTTSNITALLKTVKQNRASGHVCLSLEGIPGLA